VADDQTPISTVETDRSQEAWDGVTYVVYASERQCLPEDFEGRAEVAKDAIGEPWRAYDLHDGRCPAWTGGHCQCGLVSCFSNGRWVAEVDVFHSVIDQHSLH
jgi:hypothetical protein